MSPMLRVYAAFSHRRIELWGCSDPAKNTDTNLTVRLGART